MFFFLSIFNSSLCTNFLRLHSIIVNVPILSLPLLLLVCLNLLYIQLHLHTLTRASICPISRGRRLFRTAFTRFSTDTHPPPLAPWHIDPSLPSTLLQHLQPGSAPATSNKREKST
ncbi:hypothetical protein B0T10DRAFT_218672 [Thelonectria olida]|uniref:Uncharacterized protein n=1 Tax=Thelonectria olida TaxID=1576542 RepID=A0A9P8WBG4_9HYPO|nr:hypothetical protein B0T10DRAFT_218672 [Thelonectria olida]